MGAWLPILATSVSVATALVIPGIVGLVTLIRRLDRLTDAVTRLAETVDEAHDEHKELRGRHEAVAERVTRLEAARQK